MASIKDIALAYEASSVKNIADLDEVNVDLNLEVGFFTTDEKDDKGNYKTVDYQFIELNRQKYRVPISVIKSLKVILSENPTVEKFKVTKTGEGLKTTYTVIPHFVQ